MRVLTCTQDRKLNASQQAGWANKSWAWVINTVFANLTSPECLERLQFGTDQSRADGKEDAQCFLTLCWEICAQRAWSMASLTETQPHNWLGMCDEDIDLAQRCKDKVKRDAEIICEAHRKANENPDSCDSQVRSKSNEFFTTRFHVT